jgi:hypothetical protein
MTNTQETPRLLGLNNSNRDFSKANSWGKNQFNSSFPASLACYMYQQNIDPIYLTLDQELNVIHKTINVSNLFGLNPFSDHLFFAFESDFVPYRKYVVNKLPRVDLVTIDTSKNDLCLQELEIKLTALPDHSTYHLRDNQYGCELVIRPDTIVYLALSIAINVQDNKEEILNYFNPVCSKIENWSNLICIKDKILNLVDILDQFLIKNIDKQKPLILQPVWKTIGKSLKLAQNCLDLFVWSDFAFTRLFVDVTKNLVTSEINNIQRPVRSLIWLVKMLYEFAQNGKIDYRLIIDSLTYDTKNDKAFALSGSNTHKYMTCASLTKPRITKSKIKQIILGNGQDFLSPERRLDSVILSDPDIFN